MASSLTSSPRPCNDLDFDDKESLDLNRNKDREMQPSDEGKCQVWSEFGPVSHM